MNSSLQDCPGFEPLVALDHQRLWSGDHPTTGLTLGARFKGELIGAVSLFLGEHRGRLRDLVVRPDARRCGIGTALIEEALHHFRGHGLPLAEAQDWDAPPYWALYAALNFRRVRRYLLLRWDLTKPLPALPVNRAVMVRPADPADLEDLADLYARMYRPFWDWSRQDPLEVVRERYRVRFARRLSDKGSERAYLVAILENQFVGAITARVDRIYNQVRGAALGSLNPGGVGVLPAYRRRGIGSRLLLEALALLQERQMDQATVWTFSYLDAEAPAVTLYQRTGARVVRRSLGWEKAL